MEGDKILQGGKATAFQTSKFFDNPRKSRKPWEEEASDRAASPSSYRQGRDLSL